MKNYLVLVRGGGPGFEKLDEAENYEAAIKLCDTCPSLTIGAKLEIRECVEM